ncbi:MAG: hypothetical protein V3T48_09345, partial [Vicinamibacterales bacterium]
VSVLLNQGDGTFAAAVAYVAGNQPRSVAIGDLDGVNGPDLAVANLLSDDVSVRLNRCTAQVCPWDLNGDGEVNVADLLLLLVVDLTDLRLVPVNFGPCDGCPEDVNGDGVFDGSDAAAVATHFGPCP